MDPRQQQSQPHPAPQAPPPPAPIVVPVAPTRDQKSRNSGGWRSIFGTLAILIIAPLLAFAITAFVFQSYQVDGQSMETTLQNNDRLIIWKFPKTWARITGKDYTPNRGDVIVFVKKGLYDFNSDKEKQLIKRVIALPGERVTVLNGKVAVYNKEHPGGFDPDTTLPYGKVIPAITEGNVDITVPAGEIFVSGDNRANSLDSRYFGPVPESDIVGKLVVRILPIGNVKKF
jgi:signal peptidase I